MYCPGCANLAADAALKFCPRCGLALGGVREAFDRESGAGRAGEPGAARAGGLRRGAKSLLWGLTVGAVGYVLATTVIFLSELTPPGDAKRELLVPLRYAFLVAYFLCPFLSLYGVVRMLYALVFERGRRGAERRESARDAEDTSLLEEARAGAASLPPRRQPAHTPASFMRGGAREPEPARVSVTEQTTGLL